MITLDLVEFSWWLVGTLLSLSVKVLLLAALIWLGLTICRVRSATWRHRAWSFCFIAMLVMPLLALWAPSIPLPWAESLAWRTEVEKPQPFELQMPEATAMEVATSVDADLITPDEIPTTGETIGTLPERLPTSFPEVSGNTVETMPVVSLPPVESASLSELPSAVNLCVMLVAALYLAGCGFLVIRFGLGLVHCHGLTRRSLAVELPEKAAHLVGPAEVVQSDEISVPLCLGMVRPTILLPTDWRSWDETLLKMVLSHEGEHVRRCDPLMACLANIGTTLYWFHPVSWLLKRTLADLAEHACDDAVIGETAERNRYARILLDMAQRVSASKGRIQPLGVGMARKAEIEDRVERVIDTARPLSQRIGLKASTLLLALVAVISLATAGLTLTSQAIAQEEAATAVDTKEIVGRVVTQEGTPAKGAEVRLLTYNKSKNNYDHRTTETDEQGKFQFNEVSPGNHRIAAFYQDMASRQQRYRGPKVEAGDDVELKLVKAPTLAVQVLKESDGTPISDARVRLTWTDLKRDHMTGQDGKAVIGGLTAEEWTFEVQAQGYAENSQALQLTEQETAEVVVKLKPGFALLGTVRDEDGNPLSKAGISVRAGHFSEQLEYVTTDDKGKYRLDYMPLEGLSLYVNKDGYETITPQVDRIAAPMGERQFDMTLPKRKFGGSIRGVVTDFQGRPVSGAKLSNMGRSSAMVRKTETDAEGKYRLDNLYDQFGRHNIVVQATGLAPQKIQIRPGTREMPATYDFSLEKGRTIAGTVVGTDGKPIAGVTVEYLGADGHEHQLRSATKTDEQGKFQLDSLTEQAPLTFRKQNYSTISNHDFPVGVGKPSVVEMMEDGILRGKVVDDETGKPITDFTVHVTFSPDRQPEDPTGSLSGARVFQGQRIVNAKGNFEQSQFVLGMPLQVTIQADGYRKEVHTRVVAATAQAAQAEEFRLKKIDPSMLKSFAGQVVDANGKPVPGVQLRLIAATSRRLGSRDDFPFNWTMVQSGQLKSMAQVSQYMTAATDEEGRFRFDDVSASPDVELAYWGGGVAQGRLSGLEQLAETQRMNLVIKTLATGSLRGEINRQRFQVITRINLSGQGTFYTATISSDGKSYKFQDVSPGIYQIQVYGEERDEKIGGQTFRNSDLIFRESTRIRPGEEASVDLGTKVPPPIKRDPNVNANYQIPTPSPPESETVPAGMIRLAGQVMTPTGEGIPQARLWLPIDFRDRYIETVADAQGRFSLLISKQVIEDDEAKYISTLWGYASGKQLGSTSVSKQIHGTSLEPIAVILEPSTETSFIVESIAGKPIAGIRVAPWHYRTWGGYGIVPEPIRQLAGGTTNGKGEVTLPAVDRQFLRSTLSSGAGYGQQQTVLSGAEHMPIILKPTGRIEGVLIAPEPFDFSGTSIYLYPEDYSANGSTGYANLSTNASGEFEVSELGAGTYYVYPTLPEAKTRLRARLPKSITVVAGQITKVTIPLEPTIIAKGLILTQDEKLPVAGARLAIAHEGPLNLQMVFSQADGTYRAHVLPDQIVSVQLIDKPSEYTDWMKPGEVTETDTIPADAKEFTLPTIALVPTFPVTGKLIDAYDRPVEGVTITAMKANHNFAHAIPDAEGTFTIQFPNDYEPEKYQIDFQGRMPHRITAKVISEDPLVLQLP